ncbi:hypothetical protein ACFQX7_13480 [Luedemannella flava]
MAEVVPGDIVVGVPARDVVIVTGSDSLPGLEKARRAVDRVLFAGDENPLTQHLLVRRNGTWEPFEAAPTMPAPAPRRDPHGPDRQPRQYQDHPSWPEQRVPISAMPVSPVDRSAARRGPAPVMPAAAEAGAPRPAASGGSPQPGGFPGSSRPPMPAPSPTSSSAVPRSATRSSRRGPRPPPCRGPQPLRCRARRPCRSHSPRRRRTRPCRSRPPRPCPWCPGRPPEPSR